MLRATTLKHPPQYEIRCCYASFALCLTGQKWTPEKAINYIFNEYTLPQERFSLTEIHEIHRLHTDESMSFPKIGELLGVGYRAVFVAHKRVYGVGGEGN